MSKRGIIVGFVAACAVPAALFAQPMSEDGVSRATDGTILHRRLPGVGGGAEGTGGNGGGAAPTAETPTFVYDPAAAGGALPRDLMRDGRPLPKPSSSPDPAADEPVHTAQGLASSKPPQAGTPPAPLPRPDPDAAEDPSLTPEPRVGSNDADASDGDLPTMPGGPSTPGTSDGDAGASDPSASPGPSGDGDTAEGPPGAPPDDATDGGAAPGDEPFADPRDGLGNEALPDRHTEREGTLHYNEVFDPSIVPFKRNRALNVVGKDYALRLEAGRMERLEPIGNRLDRGHEVFWGSLLVEGKSGERIPLPSVAPESRILSYEANPPQDMRFERDDAGNFYVTPGLDGRTRLVFVMDAPSTYFGRALPSDAPLGAVPPALRPRVPKAIAKEAREVAAAIGVPANGTYAATLDALVAWFRGFTPGEPPPSKTSVYRDIALGKTGVCRHRGHGFVITAQALGIPARYVFNEAHVFVEVWVPAGAGVDAGWLRIDLGGGAEELDVHGGQGKSLHEGGPDPFSAPAPFETQREQGQTAGAERVNGLPAPEAPLPTPAAPTPGAPGAPGEGPGTSVARVVPMPELVQTTTTLTATGSIVYRGDGLDVSGRVTTLAGEPVVEGSVQLVLLVGPERRAVAQLGSTLALDKDGRFRASVAIPATQAPGSYDLVAEFLGNGVQSPSVSN